LDKATNLFWNLLIPVFGAGLFNVVGDMAHLGATAAIPASDYDISFGCGFSIVGVAASQRDVHLWRKTYGLFIVALLLSMLFDIILRYHIAGVEYQMIAASDAITFLAAGYAMWSS